MTTHSQICLTAAFSMSLALTGVNASATDIDVLMSPAGSGPYLAVATMQNYASDFTDKISPKAVETPGFT